MSDVFDLQASLELDISDYIDSLDDAERAADRLKLDGVSDEIEDVQDTIDDFEIDDFVDGIDDAQDSADDFDTGNFSDGIDDAQDSVDDFDTSNFSDSMEDAQDSADDFDVESVADSLDNAQSSFDGFNTDNFTDEVKEATDSANNMDFSGATSTVGTFAGVLSDSSVSISDITGSVAGAIGTMNVAAGEVASALSEVVDNVFLAYENLESAQSNVIRGTGATGAVLQEFTDIANDVWKAFEDGDQTLDSISNQTAELNTRFAYTGNTLGATTLLMSEFVEVTGQDGVTATDEMADIMNLFGLRSDDANEEIRNMNSLMADLVTASEASGTSVGTLESNLTRSSLALNEMGMGTDEAIALFGSFEQAVSGSSTTLANGLYYAVKSNADTLGDDLGPAINQALAQLQSSDDAFAELNKQVEGYDIKISDLFGSRYATTIAQAFSTGQVSVDDFTAALEDNETVVQEQSGMISESGDTMDGVKKTYIEAFDQIMGKEYDYSDASELILHQAIDTEHQLGAENDILANSFSGASTNILQDMQTTDESVTNSYHNMRDGMYDTETEAAKFSGAFSYNSNIAKTSADDLDRAVSTASGNISSSFSTMATDADTQMSSLKGSVSDAMADAKNQTNFTWSLPYLKMPHFTASGSFSLNPLSIPTFGVDWYAKAMDEATVLNGATIFGASGNKLLGGGEVGAEVISGEDHLVSLINESVNSAVSSQLSGIANLLTEYLPKLANMKMYVDGKSLVGSLVADMDAALGKKATLKARSV